MSAGSSSFTDHVLRELRCSELRARIVVNEVLTMRIALGAGFIDIDSALAHLAEAGALHLIGASS